MVVTPNSRIRLLKSKIELDNKNQLTFSNLNTQTNYFLSLPYLEYDNCTYVRKDNVIRYVTSNEVGGITFEDLIEYNYCMYQNTHYSNKWFYAYITDIKYINDGMTEITIETDVLQTWKFDINYYSSFVERMTVPKSEDTRGGNLLPEGLETGDYISQFVSDFPIGNSHIVMASTINPSDLSSTSGGYYGNIFSGVSYFIFNSDLNLTSAINRIAGGGKLDGISSLFYCPDFITNYANASFDGNGVAYVPSNSVINPSILVPLTPSQIDGYTPRNNKLFTYPYVGYCLSNNSGGSIVYHLEDFINSGNNLGEIIVRGTCTPGASVRAIPLNYRCPSGNSNNEYGLTLGKFPIASFPGDTYINWLTQESANIALDTTESILSVATGNVGGAFKIFNSMAEQRKHSLVPVEAKGNLNSGDITYTLGKLTYTGYMITIKYQFARCIDDYFSMYGYKVNRVRFPDFESRTNWNYIKTIGLNITGDIPQEDMQKIKDYFDDGITFWHNPSTFLDYSQSNN